MTLPAVLTTYAFSMIYLALTGTYFFFDSNVPIAVFLGMHLLFTDPSTAPKTELGRILFGVCYGLSVVALYALLDSIGAPTYYDKLLQVPIMNLLVKQFDLVGRSASWSWLNPARLGAALSFRGRSAVYVTLWILAFGVMTRASGLGNHHQGQEVPFWAAACAADRLKACDNLAQMHRRYCSAGSAWSCNELALLAVAGKAAIAEPTASFRQACRSGIVAACENLSAVNEWPHANSTRRSVGVRTIDWYCRGGRGPLPEMSTLQLFTRACNEGFVAGCGSMGDVYFQAKRSRGTRREPPTSGRTPAIAVTPPAVSTWRDESSRRRRGEGRRQGRRFPRPRLRAWTGQSLSARQAEIVKATRGLAPTQRFGVTALTVTSTFGAVGDADARVDHDESRLTPAQLRRSRSLVGGGARITR